MYENNCWTCDYQYNWGPDTFLGRCKYFETVGKEAKDIPAAMVDKGCKYWVQRKPKEDKEQE